MNESGISGQVVGAVVEDRDGRSFVGRRRCALELTPRRSLRRRLESLAGEGDCVGEEPRQLQQVCRASVGQVGVRLGDDAAGDRGQPHQIGVRSGFTTQDNGWDARGQHRFDSGLPGPVAAEDAHHDGGRTVQQRGERGERDARRVAEPVVGPAGSGRE